MKKIKTLEARPIIQRKYDKGKREVFPIRLPSTLINRIKKEAELKHYTSTEVVEIVLDYYFQSEDKT